MANVSDKHQREAEPQIGFECGQCGHWNNTDDTLELNGDHGEGTHVKSDRIDCEECHETNFVYTSQ